MKQKDNESLLEYLKFLKQAKDILGVHKDVLGHYLDNLEEFKNTTGAEDKKKIKYEEFNKLMVYLLIANSDQSNYVSMENGLANQY